MTLKGLPPLPPGVAEALAQANSPANRAVISRVTQHNLASFGFAASDEEEVALVQFDLPLGFSPTIAPDGQGANVIHREAYRFDFPALKKFLAAGVAFLADHDPSYKDAVDPDNTALAETGEVARKVILPS